MWADLLVVTAVNQQLLAGLRGKESLPGQIMVFTGLAALWRMAARQE